MPNLEQMIINSYNFCVWLLVGKVQTGLWKFHSTRVMTRVMHACAFTHTRTHSLTHMRTHTHMHTHTCTQTHTHKQTNNITKHTHAHTHTYTHTHTHTQCCPGQILFIEIQQDQEQVRCVMLLHAAGKSSLRKKWHKFHRGTVPIWDCKMYKINGHCTASSLFWWGEWMTFHIRVSCLYRFQLVY